MPLAVILPYRDVASTIGTALESVLADPACDEVVAVNDGSVDGGGDVVATMAQRDARIVCVQTNGVGMVGALRAGLSRTQADLIARMDGDDVSLPGRLSETRALILSDSSLGAVGCRVRAVSTASSNVSVGAGLDRYVAWQSSLVTKDDHARDLFVESPLCHPSVVIRRTALDQVGGYTARDWAEDYDLWLRLSLAGWGLAKVPKVLLEWHHREDRLTFNDPRYAAERFVELRAHYLAKIVDRARPLVVWGAGATGKRLARALEREGCATSCFIDIDPRKIGRTARGRSILSADAALSSKPGDRDGGDFDRPYVVAAVGVRGARELIRASLGERQFREASFGDRGDFCAAS